MIVWGGFNGLFFNDGARYNPVSNTWTAVTTTNAPGIRLAHTAVWTGSEMIVWGGVGNVMALNDGGRYNPAANSWTPVTTTGAPSWRFLHTAVWSGSEMIIWGGSRHGDYPTLNDGARYNPTSNTWTPVSASAAPGERQLHTAVWVGSEMIVWGGTNGGTRYNDGARYNPTSNTWAALSATSAPSARERHTAVWTGREMIVWGGLGDSSYPSDGACYHPDSDSWTAMGVASAPVGRECHTAVWTGHEMIIWGGRELHAVEYHNTGGIYNPDTNSWTVMSGVGTPVGREIHTAVWTGREMLVWGGDAAGNHFNDTFSYTPPRFMYLYQRP